MIRASQLLVLVMDIDPKKIRKYELDLARGIAKADGPEDHKQLMEALALLKSGNLPPTPNHGGPLEVGFVPKDKGPKLLEVLDKLFLLKKQLKPSTRLAYTNVITEFCEYTKKNYIGLILPTDVTKYQEYLAEKNKNTPRTIDNKIATIRTLYNFAIKMAYFDGKNPAELRSLVSTRDKKKGGWAVYTLDEIKRLYAHKIINQEKQSDPDYYWCILLALFTGCRISEITGLDKSQIMNDGNLTYIYVADSKTAAGIREVPIFPKLMTLGFSDFVKSKSGKLFKYQDRLGKGSGNAVSKKFLRTKDELKINRPKLVFHSLRKFLNNFLMNHDVSLEIRCQLIGHEIENVNVQTYTEMIPLQKMAKTIFPVMEKLANEIELTYKL